MLDDLPADLEKSYDRAIESSLDAALGRRAFQLVTAAARPLTLDEFRVALNVQPEDIVWNSSTLIRDPWGVVSDSCCGLIEVEEETQTIHFIHHSAMKYVLGSDKGKSTEQDVPFHGQPTFKSRSLAPFTLEEADLRLAQICVTYLNYAYFERQLVSKASVALEGSRATNTILKVAVSEAGSAGRFFNHFMRHRPDKSQAVDIVKQLQDYQRDRLPANDVLLFADYARGFWVHHTKSFTENISPKSRRLFLNLLSSTSPHVRSPVCNLAPPDVLEWAIHKGHAGIFRILMAADSDNSLLARIVAMFQRQGSANAEFWPVNGDALGNLVARSLLFCETSAPYLARDMITSLLLQGADPNLPADVNQQGRAPRLPESTDGQTLSAARMCACGAWSNKITNPLIQAIVSKQLAVAEALLARKADPNQAIEGMTPLHFAVCDTKVGLNPLQLLLESGANPAYYDAERYPTCKAPLLVAIERRDYSAVILLSNRVSNINMPMPVTPLRCACELLASQSSSTVGMVGMSYEIISAIFRALLNRGASSRHESGYLLPVVKHLDRDVVVSFMSADLRRNLGGRFNVLNGVISTILHQENISKISILDLAVQELLRHPTLDNGVNGDAAATWIGHLLRAGADPNFRAPKLPQFTYLDCPALNLAIQHRQLGCVQLLVNAGAAVDCTVDPPMQNPLMMACKTESAEMVRTVWHAWLAQNPTDQEREEVQGKAMRYVSGNCSGKTAPTTTMLAKGLASVWRALAGLNAPDEASGRRAQASP